MRLCKTILVGMILAAVIIPLPGHTAATSAPAPQAAPEPAAPTEVTDHSAPAPDQSEADPAQTETAPAPATEPPVAPSEAPADPAPEPPPAPKPVEVVQNGELKLKLNFQDTPVQAVLEYLSETVGLTIVSSEPITTSRITVIQRRAVSLKEAVDLINTMLKEKGLTAILQGKTLKVVSLDQARLESGTPVRIVRDTNDVPPDDSVATFVIPVSHISAMGLTQNLQGLLTESAQLSPNQEGNALIITDTCANVRRMMQIIKALDTHMATVAEIRVFHLTSADATSVATVINSLFQQQSQSGRGFFPSSRGSPFGGGSSPFQMMMQMRGGGPGGGMGGPGGSRGGPGGPRGQLDGGQGPGGGMGGGIPGGIGAGIGVVMSAAMGSSRDSSRGPYSSRSQTSAGNLTVQVIAVADTQTNSVVVRGPADMLDLVADVIRALDDTTAKIATVRVFQLRYADALNTADIVNQLFNPQSSSSRSRSSRSSSSLSPGPMMFRPFGEGGPGGPGMEGDASVSTVGVTAAADSRTNTIVVTGPEAVLNVVEDVIKKLDMPLSNVADVKVYHLEYADASNTAQLINEVFGQTGTSSRSRSSRSSSQQSQQVIFGRGGFGGGDTTTGSSSDIQVTASADTRTNSVVVSGPPETLEVITQIVKELDSNPEQERRIFVYPLKNGTATSLMTILNSLFQQIQTMNQRVTGSRSSTTGGQRNAGAGMASMGGGGATTGGAPGASGASSTSDSLSEETYFQADPNTNSLLIMTSSKNYEKVKPIIEELDKPVGQVLIKVLFAELTHTNDLDVGSEFSMLNLNNNGGFRTTQLFDRPLEGTAIPDDADLGPGFVGPGGLVVRAVQGDLDLTIHALQETGKLNVLSRPYVLTRNNRTAVITVADEVPVPTGTTTVAGQTQVTFDYRDDIGIVLNVTPSINEDGLVNLVVEPKITTQSAQTVNMGGGLNALVFSTRSAATRVAVKDGQTIVIGGLIQDKSSDTVSKVPLLGDIPLVGNLFRRTTADKSKIELLIFLTPYVAKVPEELEKVSQTEEKRSGLTRDKDSAELYRIHMNAMRNENWDANEPQLLP